MKIDIKKQLNEEFSFKFKKALKKLNGPLVPINGNEILAIIFVLVNQISFKYKLNKLQEVEFFKNAEITAAKIYYLNQI